MRPNLNAKVARKHRLQGVNAPVELFSSISHYLISTRRVALPYSHFLIFVLLPSNSHYLISTRKDDSLYAHYLIFARIHDVPFKKPYYSHVKYVRRRCNSHLSNISYRLVDLLVVEHSICTTRIICNTRQIFEQWFLPLRIACLCHK